MKNILFLCTANSCRSQMAEGFAKAKYGDKYNFYSAGTIRSEVNPVAREVMAERGVDLSGHKSKSVDDLPQVTMDLVVTVCSDADENCPLFPGGRVVHRGFDDPPRLAEGLTDEEEIKSKYRRVQQEIKEFVDSLEQDYLV